MRRRQRRIITKLSSYVLFVAILAFAWYLTADGLSNRRISKAEIIAVEEQRVLKEVEVAKETVVVKASVESVGTVLSSTSSTDCGPGSSSGWSTKWKCDNSHYNVVSGLTYKKGETPPNRQTDGVIFLRDFQFAKGSDGLFIPDSAATSKGICSILSRFTITAWLCDPTNPQQIRDMPIGFCFTDAEPIASLAEVSFSQPILPPTLAGSEISIRQAVYEKGEELFVKFNLDVLADKSAEDIESLCGFLSPEDGQTEEYTNIRGIDTYGTTGTSKGGGEDLVPFLNFYCNSRVPGQSPEDIAEVFHEFSEEESKDLTAMLIAHANNEWNDKAGKYVSGANSPGTDVFREKMIEQGFGGLVGAGYIYLGANVYQPRGVDALKYSQLGGSSPGTRYMNDLMTAPQFTNKVLQKNLDKVDVATKENTSSTSLSNIEGKFRQHEVERATIVDALFGGIYYLPVNLVDTVTTSTLSYHQNKIEPKTYSCDPNKNDCTLVKARSNCSGLASVEVSVRVKELYLSAVNDTSSYSGIRPDDIGSGYTRDGAFFGARNISPQGNIENAYLSELVLFSDMASYGCAIELQAIHDQIPDTDSKKLVTVSQQEKVNKLRDQFMYERQAILVSPVNVRYQVPALYEVDLSPFQDALSAFGLSISLNSIGNFLFGGSDWQYQVKMINGESIKPALISFKINNIMGSMQGFSPSDVKKKEEAGLSVEDEVNKYLENINIIKMTQARIDCGDLTLDEEGEPPEFGYWFCSTDNSDGILPTCH